MRKSAEKDEELESKPAGHTQGEEQLAPEHSRMQELGRLAGNAAVAAAMTGPEAGVRGQVEGVTGFDLSPTTIHRDSTRAASAGVHGLTEGHEVHLAPGISPGTPHGDHVLAHELGHVVQQSTGTPGNHDTLEAGAESVAHSRGSGTGPLAALPTPRTLAVQHFDPRYHRTSVVDGLAGSDFSPEEIGQIYAANWERDLSQAHPALGNVILEWKAAKVATAEGRLTPADVEAFQAACRVVYDMGTSYRAIELVTGTAYGGYKFYEHMDNPGSTGPAKKLADRGPLDTGGLPDYIYISREYIKETLFNAAKFGNPELSGSTAAVAANSRELRATLDHGEDKGKSGGMLSGPVADETTAEVRRSPGAGEGSGRTVDPAALDLIGRASHALEDFWSHSNFVELAIGDLDYQLGGLTTATFGLADKVHALSHKVRGLADEIAAETPLADRLAQRRLNNPRPDEVQQGDETPPTHDSFLGDLGAAALDLPKQVFSMPFAGATGLARGLGRAWNTPGTLMQDEAVKGAGAGASVSLVTSRSGVLLLRSLSEALDVTAQTWQEASGKREAHGLLAKDQPGHDDDAAAHLKTVKFELAHALSVAADKLVTAKMKAVVNAADPATADKLLSQIYAELDQLIAEPSASHPLASVIDPYRDSAKAALDAYNASKNTGDANLMPPMMM